MCYIPINSDLEKNNNIKMIKNDLYKMVVIKQSKKLNNELVVKLKPRSTFIKCLLFIILYASYILFLYIIYIL